MTTKLELKDNHLINAERLVLGIALHSPNAIPEIIAGLNTNDFSLSTHKLIYEAILYQYKNGFEITPGSTVTVLEKQEQLAKVGGIDYIIEITNSFFTDEEIERYIDLIKLASKARQFDNLLTQTQQLRVNQSNNFYEVFQEMQAKLLEIDLDSKKAKIIDIATSINSVISKIHELENSKTSLTGVASGFRFLDEITSGWQKSDFIILAARPSMGKTAFALNLAYNAALNKYPVAMFSVEMPAEQLTQRLLSTSSKIDSKKIRTGKGLTQQDWDKLNQSKDRLEKMEIYIDDTPGINVQQIQSKLFKLQRDHDIKLCVIDYLQLINGIGNSNGDRQNEISNISRQLKKIARDTQIPIICLSQLSRSVEKREDKRPIMSDLRDSGAIEQDADMITFLYREDYYKHDDEQSLNSNSKTDLIIAKHRNGATGVIKLNFDKEHGKFLDNKD